VSQVVHSSTVTMTISAADVRCRCGKLFFRWVAGSALLEQKCPRCGTILLLTLST
jgi:phage FluMu protein Com